MLPRASTRSNPRKLKRGRPKHQRGSLLRLADGTYVRFRNCGLSLLSRLALRSSVRLSQAPRLRSLAQSESGTNTLTGFQPDVAEPGLAVAGHDQPDDDPVGVGRYIVPGSRPRNAAASPTISEQRSLETACHLPTAMALRRAQSARWAHSTMTALATLSRYGRDPLVPPVIQFSGVRVAGRQVKIGRLGAWLHMRLVGLRDFGGCHVGS